MSILVEIFQKSHFCRKKSWTIFFPILVESFRSPRFWSRFAKNLDFEIVRKSRFWSKFSKISILVEINEKSWFWLKFSWNFDIDRNFREIAFLSKNGVFVDKIPTLVEIFAILVEIGKNRFAKMSNLVEMWENLDFGQNFEKFWQILRKSHFGSKLRKSRFWSKFCENHDFGRNLQQILTS